MSLPLASSFASRAGSRRPSETFVGVMSQPSLSRALMFPALPKLNLRANSDAQAGRFRRVVSSHSMQACERSHEKVLTPKVSRFQCYRKRRIVQARGPRHSRVDLRSDTQSAYAERLHNRA